MQVKVHRPVDPEPGSHAIATDRRHGNLRHSHRHRRVKYVKKTDGSSFLDRFDETQRVLGLAAGDGLRGE